MKLTKSERHTAYIIMLAEAEALGWIYYLCLAMEELFGFEPKQDSIKEYFPELWNKKPKDSGFAWWASISYHDSRKARIDALQQCIEETYDFEKEAVK